MRWLLTLAAALQIAAPASFAYHTASHASEDLAFAAGAAAGLESASVREHTEAAVECVLCQAAAGTRAAAPAPALHADAPAPLVHAIEHETPCEVGIDISLSLPARAPPSATFRTV